MLCGNISRMQCLNRWCGKSYAVLSFDKCRYVICVCHRYSTQTDRFFRLWRVCSLWCNMCVSLEGCYTCYTVTHRNYFVLGTPKTEFTQNLINTTSDRSPRHRKLSHTTNCTSPCTIFSRDDRSKKGITAET